MPLDTIKQHRISLKEALAARSVVYARMLPSQLLYCAGLSDAIGAEVHIKYENHNPTGSFKIRGGINLMHHLRNFDVKGVITFSTGNHGLSVATSAAWFGIQAVVVVPVGSNPSKIRSIQHAGAELVEAGQTFEEAAQVVDRLCEERGLYFVHPANEPHLINGVGTGFLEVAETLPGVEAVVVPVGAGSEAAAASSTLHAIDPGIEIYAVQAERSQAAYRSWRSGVIQTASNTTFAGGFATGTGYELPFGIYQDRLADFVLLTEDEIYQSIALAGYHTQNLVEGAGAATIMAAWKLRERIQGKRVVLQFSGGNASPEELRTAYALDAFETGILPEAPLAL